LGIDEHVGMLGALLVSLGITAGIGAAVGVAIAGNPLAFMAAAAQAGTAESMEIPLLHIFLGVLMIGGLVLALPMIVTGRALRGFKPWSRDAAMVVCALALLMFPLGTIVGVYGFWVVLSPEIEPLLTTRR
jgi:hypothetical protein